MWRFLNPPASDVFTLMALDEVLWETLQPNDSPIICLHTFKEESITLGFAQPHEQLNFPLDQLPWTRRITGGGAIHHHVQTVSFSLIARDLGEGGPKSPGPIACRLGHFLSAVWKQLGLDTHVAGKGDQATQSATLCADRLYPGDVLSGSTKVAGIGQRHRRGRLLVQAALMFDRAKGEISTDRRGFDILRTAVSELFSAAPLQDAISPEVMKKADSLKAERYTSEKWKRDRR